MQTFEQAAQNDQLNCKQKAVNNRNVLRPFNGESQQQATFALSNRHDNALQGFFSTEPSAVRSQKRACCGSRKMTATMSKQRGCFWHWQHVPFLDPTSQSSTVCVQCHKPHYTLTFCKFGAKQVGNTAPAVSRRLSSCEKHL